jgi:hypothetical protein
MTQRKISFELFAGLWNARQNQATPRLHCRMASWLSQQARAEQKRLLLMAFRGSGKSTLVGLFCAWLLSFNPDLRILVVAADEELAEHMVRHVRGILEIHPLTGDLLPVHRKEWAADRLTVKRPMISRDPSLRAAGITSNITGARADIIICDDVEVPKTCDSAWKREQLRTRLNELDFILTPDGMMLYIGTPHTEDSLYKKDGFLKHFQRLEIPLDIRSWPERFTPKIIDNIRSSVGPRIFASQMELQNLSLTQARLNPDLLQFYDDDIPERIIAQRCYWDPAFGHDKGDASVIAYVAFNHSNNAYLHDLLYLKTETDNAAQGQCRNVVDFLICHKLKQIHIEGNGLGQFLPGLLRQALRDADYSCAVHIVNNTTNKAQRLLQAFDARLAAKAFFIRENLRHSGFIEEMKDWQPNQPNPKDDALDAVAGALLHQPPVAHRNFAHQFFLQDDS